MSDEIVLEGNTYVSSKRASEMSSYAQDYIGQLARKGLIEARRVGGLWYVVMQSLENYKSTAASGEVKEAKQVGAAIKESETSIEFEGNTYISASRASEITGYNQDYVGQLARSGKIASRQVGNRWYVDPQAIAEHKKEKDALLAKVQSDSVGISTIAIRKTAQASNTTDLEGPQLLTYKSTEGDLIPHIKGREYSDEKAERDRYSTRNVDVRYTKATDTYHTNPIRITHEYSKIGQPRYNNQARNDSKIIKYVFVGAIIVLIIISILVGLFKFGSVGQLLTQMPNLNTPESSPINNWVLSRILGAVEQLISPELLYIRQ